MQLYNEYYRRIVETTEEGIWIVDTRGKTLFVNQKMADLLGYSREEILDRDKLELIDVGQKERSRLASAETTSIQREYKFQCKNGGVLWTLVNASPLFDGKGQYIGNLLMLTDITERKKLEASLAQSNTDLELKVRERTAELSRANEQLALFAKKLIEVQEEERKRISRELHDDTAQHLALLSLELDTLAQKGKGLSSEVVSNLKRLWSIADQALQEVRRFSHEMRPNVLEQFGLGPALETIISEFNNRGKVKVNFRPHGAERRLKEEIELSLFRITQEALNNIRKHSQAASAEVTLQYTSSKVRLTISDDGKGFDVSQKRIPSANGGLGLVGMEERAEIIGADLQIKSRLGSGTIISVEVFNK